MSVPSYSFQQFEREFLFTFESVSDEKTIRKVIVYELFDTVSLIYNVALVDIDKKGEASDLVVSNNKDMEMVLSTVIQTFPVFFKRQPLAKIFLKGSTDVRTRLYQMAINKYLDFFEPIYEIYGYLGDSLEEIPEKFMSNRHYKGFLIRLKTIHQNENERK